MFWKRSSCCWYGTHSCKWLPGTARGFFVGTEGQKWLDTYVYGPSSRPTERAHMSASAQFVESSGMEVIGH